MIITVSNRSSLVKKWVELLAVEYKLNPREVQVAHIIISQYLILKDSREKLSGKAKQDYDPFKLVKSAESVTNICSTLNMTFLVLREYLKTLKNKGVFIDGGINPVFIPGNKQATITVQWT